MKCVRCFTSKCFSPSITSETISIRTAFYSTMTSLGFFQHMLSLILILAFLQACVGNTTVPSRLNYDVLGLLVYIHDPSSYLASWNEDDDSPCSWDYVQCNPAIGKVS